MTRALRNDSDDKLQQSIGHAGYQAVIHFGGKGLVQGLRPCERPEPAEAGVVLTEAVPFQWSLFCFTRRCEKRRREAGPRLNQTIGAGAMERHAISAEGFREAPDGRHLSVEVTLGAISRVANDNLPARSLEEIIDMARKVEAQRACG